AHGWNRNDMKKPNPISPDLIAPCGINCALCSRYLSFVNNLKRSQCVGCRPRNKRCVYLFKNCEGSKNISKGNAAFCFECEMYPCKQIDRIDTRYRNNYKVGLKENLEFIRKNGIKKFVKEQYKKYRCPKCGGLISMHNRKCFKCDTITKLVEKYT
ncbi:MAG TPA: DUF3795 domain-containing protein, partial [Chitinivibrionales bacterium]